MKNIPFLFLVITSFSISNCNFLNRINVDWRKPLLINTKAPPNSHILYKKGWEDGCESALSATNITLYMFIGVYKYKLDSRLWNYFLYNKAWQYGYEHCGYSIKTYKKYNLK